MEIEPSSFLHSVVSIYLGDIAGSVPEQGNKASHMKFLASLCIIKVTFILYYSLLSIQ